MHFLIYCGSFCQLKKPVAFARKMVGVKLCARNFVINNYSQQFVGLGHELRAEESSVLVYQFLLLVDALVEQVHFRVKCKTFRVLRKGVGFGRLNFYSFLF